MFHWIFPNDPSVVLLLAHFNSKKITSHTHKKTPLVFLSSPPPPLILESATVINSQNHLYLVLLYAVGVCQWWCTEMVCRGSCSNLYRNFCQNLQMLRKSPFQSLKTKINWWKKTWTIKGDSKCSMNQRYTWCFHNIWHNGALSLQEASGHSCDTCNNRFVSVKLWVIVAPPIQATFEIIENLEIKVTF